MPDVVRKLHRTQATQRPLHNPLSRDTAQTTIIDPDYREGKGVTLEAVP